MRLIHFGDLHLWRFGFDGDPSLKRLLGLTNLALHRARLFPEAIAQALASRLAEEEAGYILFSGDLSTASLRAEFEAGRRLFAPLIERNPGRWIAIAGNHDRYTPRAQRNRLFERHFSGPERSYPYTVDLNDQWTLVVIDCSVARLLTARGRLSRADLEQLDHLLTAQQSRGRRLAVMGHYPIALPPGVSESRDHRLPRAAELLDLLQRRGVRLYLHGHKHRRWRLRMGQMEILNCGAAGMRDPSRGRWPGFLRIELGPEAVTAVDAIETECEGAQEAIRWQVRPLEPVVLGGGR